MSRPTVFLTGASGTVGSGILEALVEDGGFSIHALVRDERSRRDVERVGARAVPGDLADHEVLAKLATDAAFDYIVHAAQASYHTHAQAHIDALEALAVRHLDLLCANTTRLKVFISGVWSWGSGAGGRILSEVTPRIPFAPARARAALCDALTARSERPWTELAPPSIVYGTRGPFARAVERIHSESTVAVLDEPTVLWSVIEHLDLGRACVALLRSGRPGGTFLVAEDEPVGKLDFYRTIQQALGRGHIAPRTFAEMADAGPMLEIMQTGQPVDSTLFKRTTGWRASRTFATAAPDLARRIARDLP